MKCCLTPPYPAIISRIKKTLRLSFVEESQDCFITTYIFSWKKSEYIPEFEDEMVMWLVLHVFKN